MQHNNNNLMHKYWRDTWGKISTTRADLVPRYEIRIDTVMYNKTLNL